MCRLILLFGLFIYPLFISADNNPDFVSPVRHKLRISGSFAEFRTNHFHSGIDIKSSKGRVGDPLQSIGDGYVSRIKIQSGGYGNVLFISHPSGHTSVYAHMDNFLPEIDAYVKELQYALECFEIEAHLPPDKFVVDKGQFIGNMGTTGRSTGPHLHFEIRETKSDKPLNPYLFGIAPADDQHPQIQNIAYYNLEDESDPKRLGILGVQSHGSSEYHIHKAISLNTNRAGFSIQMFDRMNGASNKNEVYSCTMIVDDSLEYKWKSDDFDFSDTKYVNARLDYERKSKVNQNLQLLFKQDCNQLKMVENNDWNGIISLNDNSIHKALIILEDLAGNKSTLTFEFNADSKKTPIQNEVNDRNIICSMDTIIYLNDLTIEIPQGTFYHDTQLEISKDQAELNGLSYPTLSIGEDHIPAHKFYKLVMKLPEGFGANTCLIKKTKKGKLKNFGATIENGFITCYLDEFGKFYLYKDESLPKIETIRFDKNPSKYSEWRFKMTDILDPDGYLDDLSYKATINGKWVRLLYDKKNDLLRFVDFDKIPKGSSEFVVFAADNQGNSSSRTYQIES